jgi:hypothetical protein
MARRPQQKHSRRKNDRWIKLMASSALLEAVTEQARREGRSMSNFVRSVLVERLKADGVIVRDDIRPAHRPRIVRDDERVSA